MKLVYIDDVVAIVSSLFLFMARPRTKRPLDLAAYARAVAQFATRLAEPRAVPEASKQGKDRRIALLLEA